MGTVGILFLAWRYLSIDVLVSSLNNLVPMPIFISMAIYIAINLLRGLRFILLGSDISVADAFSMASVHTALLRVLPLRSGELSLGVMLKRTGQGGFGQGVATILVLRIVDFALIMIMAAASVGTYLKLSGKTQIAVIILLALLLIGFLFFLSTPIARSANRFITTRSEKSQTSLWVRSIKAVAAVLELSFQRRILLLLVTIALWFLIIVWFYLLVIGTGLSVSKPEGFSVGMLGILGSMLPLSLIGSFGPLEGGIALGLCAVGFAPEIAASHSVIISSITFVQNWILALPGWFWVFFRSKK
jgi:uncharacterized protein (TIRG00374 family)